MFKGSAQEIKDNPFAANVASRVFEHASDPILVSDKDGRILVVNQAFTRLTGYAQEEVKGKPASILRSSSHPSSFYDAIWKSIQGPEGNWQGELISRDKYGKIFSEWFTVYRIDEDNGQPQYYVGTFSGRKNKMQSQANFSRMATHDPLTGLPNKVLLEDRLDYAITTCRRQDRRLALMFIDIDNFRLVNEKLGYNVGDMMLKQAASRLHHCLRDVDTVARIGGDEFVVFIEGCSPHQASVVSERIMEQLKDEFEFDGSRLSISGSIGISFFPDDGDTPEQLIRAADTAMYRAKEFGVGRIEVFKPDLKSQILRRSQIENDLRQAIASGMFDVVYQPKFNIQGSKLEMVGVESLSRWCSDSFGFISPAEFIPVAESSGLIRKFDEAVVKKILAQMVKWRLNGVNIGKVAFNISASSLKDDSFAESIIKMVSEHAISPENIQVEVTESVLIDHAEIAYRNLHVLCDAGIKLSIDDFGTGYSSLNYLKRLPFSELKIDKSFIDGLGVNQEEAIATAILDIAKALNMVTVAEGIETIEQMNWLTNAGVNHGQGFFLAKPMSSGDLVKFIKNGSICCSSKE